VSGTTADHGAPAPSQPISADELRHALGHFTTGVTVVTTTSASGEPVGTTASAVSALSLDPPLVLVCLARSSQTLAEVGERGRFAVNVLSAAQRHLSDNFARRGDGAAWSDVVHRLDDSGVASPRLDGALAVIECELAERVEGGDHEIVVGRIRELEVGGGDLRPLVHFRGAYAALADELFEGER
jgi:3-hydroxy-9,10-secoandrosta-1,3,5(10)-triene-9,17-dione monooxygenase reductase component